MFVEGDITLNPKVVPKPSNSDSLVSRRDIPIASASKTPLALPKERDPHRFDRVRFPKPSRPETGLL